MSDWQPSAAIATLEVRARMLRAAREYFAATGTLEVETPTLSPSAVTDVHLASVQAQVNGRTAWLHTSPEYAMKRLLAAGTGDIYQIARVYRDGESGRYHNPEFTMLEWYRVGLDHHALMSDVERLITTLLPPERSFDRAERLSYGEAVQLHAGVDPFDDEVPVLIARLESAGIEVPRSISGSRDACLDLMMSTLVGPKLGADRLTFVYDYPASQAALARIRGRVASRFEAYYQGLELANGFHELGNADEQHERFRQDLALRAAAGSPEVPIDLRFIEALRAGLPDCSGVALGFDRLVMCATGATHIDQVLAFPLSRA